MLFLGWGLLILWCAGNFGLTGKRGQQLKYRISSQQKTALVYLLRFCVHETSKSIPGPAVDFLGVVFDILDCDRPLELVGNPPVNIMLEEVEERKVEPGLLVDLGVAVTFVVGQRVVVEEQSGGGQIQGVKRILFFFLPQTQSPRDLPR